MGTLPWGRGVSRGRWVSSPSRLRTSPGRRVRPYTRTMTPSDRVPGTPVLLSRADGESPPPSTQVTPSVTVSFYHPCLSTARLRPLSFGTTPVRQESLNLPLHRSVRHSGGRNSQVGLRPSGLMFDSPWGWSRAHDPSRPVVRTRTPLSLRQGSGCVDTVNRLLVPCFYPHDVKVRYFFIVVAFVSDLHL